MTFYLHSCDPLSFLQEHIDSVEHRDDEPEPVFATFSGMTQRTTAVSCRQPRTTSGISTTAWMSFSVTRPSTMTPGSWWRCPTAWTTFRYEPSSLQKEFWMLHGYENPWSVHPRLNLYHNTLACVCASGGQDGSAEVEHRPHATAVLQVTGVGGLSHTHICTQMIKL